MTIHEFGEENESLLILFHPLGVHWDVFNYVVPLLKDGYHLVIPALPGFDPDAPEADFISVEQIADEMTTMLDPLTQARICTQLVSLTRDREIGLLLISHNPALVDRLCDDAVRLEEINSR